MIKLTFNQKVAFGFAVILVLLIAASGSSFYTLRDIDKSNTRVNELAVPVVAKANEVQIQLLKLANLSALGYNAQTEEDILPYRDNFQVRAKEFTERFAELEKVAANDQELAGLVAEIKTNYDTYTEAVNQMFAAKLATLIARAQAQAEAQQVINLVDDVGFAFMDIANYLPKKEEVKDFTLLTGFVNQADALLSRGAKFAGELRATTEMEKLDTAQDDFEFIVSDAMTWFDKVDVLFKPMDQDGFIPEVHTRVERVLARINADPNLITFKREQLKQADIAAQQLEQGRLVVGKAVEGLDAVLTSANGQFAKLQNELGGALSFGFKSTLVMMIVLLALATQNFNSMRLAIRRKMIDLAKLNHIGGGLAAARDQNSALEQVLHAMHEKTGIAQGSVYLMNRDQQLEAKAFLPPKQIRGDSAAVRFTLGEGIMGQAAKTKQPIYVPDTSRDGSYVQGANEPAKALLCVPLVDKDMLIGVMNFSGEVDKVEFADSDYEFVASVARSLVTTIKNIRMVEVIEEHNRNLEKKVEERTAALKQKNDDIANMLSNMHQGLFTIVEGGLIHPEYAAYLETIFETKSIANRNFVDLLFRNCALSTDAIDGVTTSVASIVGEDAMMYDFNSHLLVSEMTLQFADKPDKLLELDWDPIVDENDVVTKLMVTVRDVTSLKALQAEAESQKQELMMIGEILAVDGDKFNEFVEGSTRFIDQCRDIISQTSEKEAGTLAELFRNIHTVKGNARTYGLKYLTETVHEVENTFDKLRKNEEMPWEPQSLLHELQFADDAVKRYASIFSEKLGMGGGRGGSGVKVDKKLVDALMTKIAALEGVHLPDNVVSIVRDTYHTLVAIEAKPISEIISDVVVSVKSLAKELDKAEPEIKIDDGGVFIRNEAQAMLNNTFMHLLRNAMDHGIELPAVRKEKGKPEQGRILVKAKQDQDKLIIAIKDDGKGMAIGHIFKKAVELGMYAADAARPPAAEVANLIFASGFSTAEAVTEVSGRGVGMDAVKQFLESEGGGIKVVLDEGDDNADFRSFTTYIKLPARFFVSPPEFAKAS